MQQAGDCELALAGPAEAGEAGEVQPARALQAELQPLGRGSRRQLRPAIDMPAGPSEVLVIADSGANPAFVAADLLSQAEHGPDSQVILLSDDDALLDAAAMEVERQLATLPRADIARRALEHSRLIRVAGIAEREQHHPELHLTNYRHVAIELTTHAIGGLSENDFIVAAKIDEVPVKLKQ